jgi:CRP/FNR family cyclic AMP-dependent transcriptional regulator
VACSLAQRVRLRSVATSQIIRISDHPKYGCQWCGFYPGCDRKHSAELLWNVEKHKRWSDSVKEPIQDKRLEKRLALLKEMNVFRDLREADLMAMVDDLRLREYEKDDLIFRQGDESREIYFVLKGKVRVYKISPAGVETSIDIFSSNDVIGELAALDGRPRSATAKAITPVSLLAMAQERFTNHMRTQPGLALGLARVLAQKLRWTAAYAESIAQFDAAGRLLHIILLNSERYGIETVPGQQFVVDIGLNQTDLASMVGARREWVNRILSDWRKRGLLEFEGGVITIFDLPRVIAERDSRLEANVVSEDW